MWALLLALTGCGLRTIPPHLQVAAEAPPAPPPTGLAGILAGDPLARHPVLPDPSWTPDDPALAAWLVVTQSPEPDWWALERAWPGTIAVPLSRGARLVDVEVRLATGSPLADLPTLVPPPARQAIPPELLRPELLHHAERQVLLGWLDGPAIDLSAPAAALAPGRHDRLLDHPLGVLLQARAAAAADPERAAAGVAALTRATTLALQEVSADRDREQADWAAARDTATEELGGAPIDVLLASAATDLTADASADASTGQALVALTALRIRGTCSRPPCAGFDRGVTLNTAGRWAATDAAALWRVIALKEMLDTIEVAAGHPGFGRHLPDLLDVLRGLDAPLEAATDPPALVPELATRLSELAAEAAPTEPAQQVFLTRLSDRAAKTARESRERQEPVHSK